MSDSVLETRVEGQIGIMTLNRPQFLNPFNGALIGEIGRALAAFDADPAVSAIVVHGNGRAFSAGFDLKEAANKPALDNEQWRQVIEYDFDFIMQFWDCAKPTIAAVPGFCLSGGFGLGLA